MNLSISILLVLFSFVHYHALLCDFEHPEEAQGTQRWKPEGAGAITDIYPDHLWQGEEGTV